LTPGEHSASATAGSYLWQPPGKPVGIHLNLDVVDRLLQDVMRGFGAVPKRGAEVGGILLGKADDGDRLVVSVDDYELVPIEYRLGPSYLLSEVDRASFKDAFERLSESAKETGAAPIGFFRSQTRDAVGLVPEDLALIDQYFPEADKIVLLIKPYATRVSTAGFYFREDGSFQSGPPLAEFNFRRKDLGGGEPAAPRPGPPIANRPPTPERVNVRTAPVSSFRERLVQEEAAPPPRSQPIPDRAVSPGVRQPAAAPTDLELPAVLKTQSRGGWVWLPISFIFLLLGVLLGFQASLTLRTQTTPGDQFGVALAVTRDGDNLSVHWDRQAPAIRAATRGLLLIGDGKNTQPVSLSADQLQTGIVVYPHKNGEVKFRLELTFKSGAVLVQKLNWQE
jgi:hypothetical protein